MKLLKTRPSPPGIASALLATVRQGSRVHEIRKGDFVTRAGELAKRGSLFLTRPSLFAYTAQRSDLVQMADELFGMVTAGKVRIEVNQTYALRDAARAQADLAAREIAGE